MAENRLTDIFGKERSEYSLAASRNVFKPYEEGSKGYIQTQPASFIRDHMDAFQAVMNEVVSRSRIHEWFQMPPYDSAREYDGETPPGMQPHSLACAYHMVDLVKPIITAAPIIHLATKCRWQIERFALYGHHSGDGNGLINRRIPAEVNIGQPR